MGDTLRCRYCMIALNSKKEPFAMDWHRCAHGKTCYANRHDADRAPASRRRQAPHPRVSQGRKKTVLGESA